MTYQSPKHGTQFQELSTGKVPLSWRKGEQWQIQQRTSDGKCQPQPIWSLTFRQTLKSLDRQLTQTLLILLGGTTGQVLSKTSGTDLAFTWIDSDDTNAIQNAIVDAKGDLIGATAADTPSRLAVGTDGQILTADFNGGSWFKWSLWKVMVMDGSIGALDMMIYAPYASEYTKITGLGTASDVSSLFTGVKTSSASFTSITFQTSTGNVTGTYRVYGLANS
jgi:hypothetical protein